MEKNAVNQSEKNHMFLRIEELCQKLFFNPSEVGPATVDPTKSSKWETYVEYRNMFNKYVDAGSKVVKIIVTQRKNFFTNKGWVTSYYQELVLGTDNFDEKIRQIKAIEGTLVHSVIEME